MELQWFVSEFGPEFNNPWSMGIKRGSAEDKPQTKKAKKSLQELLQFSQPQPKNVESEEYVFPINVCVAV